MNSIAGIPILLSEQIPKVEGEVTLEFTRSILHRLISGKMHDVKVTEEDALLLMDVQRYDFIYNRTNRTYQVLVMNRSMYNKLKKVMEP